MNFKGGVIIIGSLIWDMNPIREKWRRLAFRSVEERITVPVKIRYGRQSKSRFETFSMIFSNHPSTQFGKGIVLEFDSAIKNFEMLKDQAYALAYAEGICKDLSNPTINANWGTVGIIFNPSIEGKDKSNADWLKMKWGELYKGYRDSFTSEEYASDKGEIPVIDRFGHLKIDWVKEMDKFDFLLATATKPSHGLITSREIASRMNEKKYWEYFDKNVENGIYTFQDKEIAENREISNN